MYAALMELVIFYFFLMGLVFEIEVHCFRGVLRFWAHTHIRTKHTKFVVREKEGKLDFANCG